MGVIRMGSFEFIRFVDRVIPMKLNPELRRSVYGEGNSGVPED